MKKAYPLHSLNLMESPSLGSVSGMPPSLQNMGTESSASFLNENEGYTGKTAWSPPLKL